MGLIHCGYGSEWHLLRYMGRHRHLLDQSILNNINSKGWIEWLDFGFNSKSNTYDEELKGLEFLSDPKFQNAQLGWTKFWPQTGNPPNWDAVGWLRNGEQMELLLVEAKAHVEEIESDCGAGDASLLKIKASFSTVQQGLGIHPSEDWTKEYYQFANRLSVLYFLNDMVGIPSRLVIVYFTGDQVKDKICPQSAKEWQHAIDLQNKHLGLDQGYKLENRVHKVFLPVC